MKGKHFYIKLIIAIVIIVIVFAIILTIIKNKRDVNTENIIENASEYLGAKVNYEVGNDELQESLTEQEITWKVFYADDEHIYLIASDYILAEDAPSSENGTSPIYEDTSYAYSLYLNDICSDFTGITGWDEKVSKWNSNYLEYYTEETYNSTKSVEYLLNTTLWSDYTNSDYAEYSIGGPTIEMWMASWNLSGYSELYCNNVNTYGYYIGNNESQTETWAETASEIEADYKDTIDGAYDEIADDEEEYSSMYETLCEYFGEEENIDENDFYDYFYQYYVEVYYSCATLDENGSTDTLYFPEDDGTYCDGYWLASPSYIEDFVRCICNGGVINSYPILTNVVGYRVVVALDSDVQLDLADDGTYNITK